jgi:hypothetical protein
MTDEERARTLVERFRNGHSDHTGLAIEDEAFLHEIVLAAFAAIREECTKEREEVRRIAMALLTGDYSANDRDKWSQYLLGLKR